MSINLVDCCYTCVSSSPVSKKSKMLKCEALPDATVHTLEKPCLLYQLDLEKATRILRSIANDK